MNAARAPIPSLLAVRAVHHHLIDAGERMHASLIVESGEPREVHHFAALLGYGANAINPWLALASIDDGLAEGGRHAAGHRRWTRRSKNFVKAVEKGILKVMSKMGIATLDSYCGAQVFEALGISDELIQRVLRRARTTSGWAASAYEDLARDVLAWHRNGIPEVERHAAAEPKLDSYGFYKAARGGEQHAFSPEVVRALHEVVGLGKGQRSRRRRAATASIRLTPITPPTALRDLVEERAAGRAARPAGLQHGRPAACPAGRGRAGRGDPAALLARGHVARRAERGGARGADHRHEPAGRHEQQRRGRRGRGALRHGAQQQDQAGGVGPLRRHARPT